MFERGGLRVGQVAGVTVRLHWIFLVWAIFELLESHRFGGAGSAAMYLGFLFGSVFLHELGHCRSARRVGGTADEVLLWPLGGLASVNIPDKPLSHLAVASGGPVVNLVLWLLLLPLVIYSGEPIGSIFLRLPAGTVIDDPIALAAAVNLDLLIFNLLPALPLDGGRILHAYRWKQRGELAANRSLVFSGKVVAGGMALLWFIADSMSGLVLALAVLILIQSIQMQKALGESMGSGGGGSWRGGASGGPGWWQRQKDNYRIRKMMQKQRRDAEMRSRVDALLKKVSTSGIDSLTAEEKRFLDRSSERFEDRSG